MAKKKKKNESEYSAKGDINKWLAKIKRAEAVRDEADKKYGYSRALLMYQNDFEGVMPSFMKDTDIIPINEVYAYTKTFVPTVYSRDPYLTITPKSTRMIEAAKILELAINSYWRELRLKKECRRVIIDSVLAEGWLKTGYAADIGHAEDEPALEPSEFIKNDEIFGVRVSWKNMVRDPDAIDGIHDARWVAERIVRPLAAVRASSLYENTAALRPAFVTKSDGESYGSSVPKDECEYAVLYEVWDRDTNRVFTISEGSDEYLMDKKWPYEMEGFPYVLLRFNENPDEPYAPNLIAAWEPQLWEKIKLRSMQLDHIKRFNRQMSIEEGTMSDVEIEKLAQGRTGSVTKRKKGSMVPQPIPYPQVQADIYAVEGKIDLDKDNISGQPNAVRSAPQKTQSRTLGEIDRLISAFQSRQGEPQDRVEEFCEEVAYKIIKLMQQYLSGEKYVRATQKQIEEIQAALVDADGQPRWDGRGFVYTREDIQDVEFEADVKSGSSLPLDKQNRLETLNGLLKLGPTLGIQPGGKVARTLGKSLLAELEMKEVEAAFDEEMRQIEAQQAIAAKMQEQSVERTEMMAANMKAAGPEGMLAQMEMTQGAGGAPKPQRPPRAQVPQQPQRPQQSMGGGA